MPAKSKSFFRFKPENFVSVRYQLFFLAVVTVCSILFVLRPITQFNPLGPSPRVHQVTETTIAAWGREPERVKVGMMLKDFLVFGTERNEFVVNAFVWFKYNPQKVSLDTLGKFSFTKGEFVEKHEPYIEKIDKNTSQATYFVRVKFSSILDYQRFPLNDHRLFLNLTNTAISARDIIFDADANSMVLSPSLFVSGWTMQGSAAQGGYSKTIVGDEELEQPRVVFSVDASKHDIRQLILILLPMLLIFYFGLFSLAFATPLSLGATAITALSAQITYILVVVVMSPVVGYFMMSDFLILFFLSSIFWVLFTLGLKAANAKFLSEAGFKKFVGWTVLGLNLAFLIVWFYLTNIFAL